MRYYLIAGEASGDIHGANLVKALRSIDSKAVFRAWGGGDRLRAELGSLVRHFRDTAFMGFVDVVINLQTILKNLNHCQKDILSWNPDAVILIDYPGFNMRIAKWLKARKLPIKIIYYISPQVWAWKSGRVLKLKETVDEMMVILPFEKNFYEKRGFQVTYVGHPLLDEIEDQFTHRPASDQLQNTDGPIVAILPGSRKQEINNLLNTMLSLAEEFPNYDFVIAGLAQIPKEVYQKHIPPHPNILLATDDTPNILRHATFAVVASGTATLLTALYNVPQIVCYRGNLINYWIAKNLINIKFISLVNLILDRPLVTELIQTTFTRARLKQVFLQLQTKEIQSEISMGYAELRNKLGGPGASKKAASHIFTAISKSDNHGYIHD